MSERYGLKEVKRVVYDRLVPLVGPGVVFALRGPLGVGKTTIVQELMRQLGLDSPVVSPTFSYLNEYKLPGGLRVLHFDLYRVSSVEEFELMGFDELVGDETYFSLIEWPELVLDKIKNLSGVRSVYSVDLGYLKDDLNFRQISVVQHR